MSLFVKRSCVALTWSETGECRGVYLKRNGDKCTVLRSWQASSVSSSVCGEVLRKALYKLKPDSNTIVVLGGSGLCCGFKDIIVPRLPNSDMRNALSFQVNQLAPMSSDKLVWGYRNLGNVNKESVLVRVVYLRENIWSQWLGYATNLGKGVDIIIPAISTIDPVFMAKDVALFDAQSESSFVLSVDEQGIREVNFDVDDKSNLFGVCPQPLAYNKLNLSGSELLAMEEDEQQTFADTLILGMYGLTRAVGDDKKTWVTLPQALKNNRHRTNSILATVIAIVLSFVLGAGAIKHYKAAKQCLRKLSADTYKTEQRIKSLQTGDDNQKLFVDFQEEITKCIGEYELKRYTLPAVLRDITRVTDNDCWVKNFRWNDGIITMTMVLYKPKDGLDLKLEACQTIASVKQKTIIKRNENEQHITWEIIVSIDENDSNNNVSTNENLIYHKQPAKDKDKQTQPQKTKKIVKPNSTIKKKKVSVSPPPPPPPPA